MITTLKIFAVAALSFLAAACQQTFEDDYQHSSSIYGDADSGVWEKINKAAQGG
jgi:hypothetical protein